MITWGAVQSGGDTTLIHSFYCIGMFFLPLFLGFIVLQTQRCKLGQYGYKSFLPVLIGLSSTSFFVAAVASPTSGLPGAAWTMTNFSKISMIVGTMTLVPILVWMLGSTCRGCVRGNTFLRPKYTGILLFFGVELGTMTAGILQATYFPGQATILMGSVVGMITVAQFFFLAGCVGHNGNGDRFKDVSAKKWFLAVTTSSGILLAFSTWDIGWTGGCWNMFAFSWCLFLAVLMPVMSCKTTKHSNKTTNGLVIFLGLSILTVGTGILSWGTSTGSAFNVPFWAPIIAGASGIVIFAAVLIGRSCGKTKKGLCCLPKV